MIVTRKYALVTAINALLFIFPDKLFSQWYAGAEYRFGTDKRSLSDLEMAQTDVSGAKSVPYTLGGYTFSSGYTYRPDSINVAFSAGISYLKSNSGNILYSYRPIYPTYATLKHDALTFDLGMSFEFKIKAVHGSSGFDLLMPVYMRGFELQHTETQFVLIEKRREISYNKAPGIRFHQEFSVWSRGNMLFYTGVSAGWISALRKSRTLILGDMSTPVSQREMQYLTDRQVNEKGKINDPSLSGFDTGLPMETKTYNEPISYVALKMGLVYYLRRK